MNTSTIKVASILIFMVLPAAAYGARTEEEKQKFRDYLAVKKMDGVLEADRSQLRENYFYREDLANAIDGQSLLDSAKVQAELREYEKDILINRYFEEFLEDAVTRQDARAYYQVNKDDYKYKKIHMAHILFRVKEGATEEEALEVKRSARSVLKNITEQGASFSEMVQAHSQHRKSKLRSGDMGWVKEGFIDDGFSIKLFRMAEVDEPKLIQSSWGFHIVRIIEGEVNVTLSFDDVSTKILKKLRRQAKVTELERLNGI